MKLILLILITLATTFHSQAKCNIQSMVLKDGRAFVSIYGYDCPDAKKIYKNLESKGAKVIKQTETTTYVCRDEENYACDYFEFTQKGSEIRTEKTFTLALDSNNRCHHALTVVNNTEGAGTQDSFYSCTTR